MPRDYERKIISGKELIKRMPLEVREALKRISKLPVEDWKRHYEEMKKSGQRRLRMLIRLEKAAAKKKDTRRRRQNF